MVNYTGGHKVLGNNQRKVRLEANLEGLRVLAYDGVRFSEALFVPLNNIDRFEYSTKIESSGKKPLAHVSCDVFLQDGQIIECCYEKQIDSTGVVATLGAEQLAMSFQRKIASCKKYTAKNN